MKNVQMTLVIDAEMKPDTDPIKAAAVFATLLPQHADYVNWKMKSVTVKEVTEDFL